jgi:hypothetical protein
VSGGLPLAIYHEVRVLAPEGLGHVAIPADGQMRGQSVVQLFGWDLFPFKCLVREIH